MISSMKMKPRMKWMLLSCLLMDFRLDDLPFSTIFRERVNSSRQTVKKINALLIPTQNARALKLPLLVLVRCWMSIMCFSAMSFVVLKVLRNGFVDQSVHELKKERREIGCQLLGECLLLFLNYGSTKNWDPIWTWGLVDIEVFKLLYYFQRQESSTGVLEAVLVGFCGIALLFSASGIKLSPKKEANHPAFSYAVTKVWLVDFRLVCQIFYPYPSVDAHS